MKTLVGQKIGMTHIFDEAGAAIPVTVLQVGPCVVTQLKTPSRDGYAAVQLGFGTAKRPTRAVAGHQKPAGTASRHLREVRVAEDELEGLTVGDSFSVELFSDGDVVQVIGTSKGKGFAGTIKRHNFHRGPKTHGSHNVRAPGSIGSMFPQKVKKGLKMAGRHGAERTTVKNLRVVGVDVERDALLVRGAVPGPKKGLVLVQGSGGSG